LRSPGLDWIDTYFSHVKNYIFLRREDKVLILPPNKVFRLNDTGVRLLSHLYNGKSVRSFPGIDSKKRIESVNLFFSNLRGLYENKIDDPSEAFAIETVPYDFQFTQLPVLGEIAVTYRCNNRCRFCYAGCGADTPNNREMNLSEIKNVLKIFKDEAKIPFFSFTGGEPLLRNDLEKMIRYASKLKLRTNLVTNGTLAAPARARSLYKAGLRTAQVSLEAEKEELHDYLTGALGAFKQTLSGIYALMQAGISVQTNTTITNLNMESAVRLPGFLAGKGVKRFAMNLFIPTEDAGKNSEELFLSYEKIGEVVEAVGKEARRYGLVFYWYSPTPHCYYNPIARGRGNKSCAAMDGLLSVSPAGEVLPCSSYNEPIGNLLKEPFGTIWFSDRAAFFKNKKYAPEECGTCDSFTACQGACPLYWKYAGTSILRNKKRSDSGSYSMPEGRYAG